MKNAPANYFIVVLKIYVDYWLLQTKTDIKRRHLIEYYFLFYYK